MQQGSQIVPMFSFGQSLILARVLNQTKWLTDERKIFELVERNSKYGKLNFSIILNIKRDEVKF